MRRTDGGGAVEPGSGAVVRRVHGAAGHAGVGVGHSSDGGDVMPSDVLGYDAETIGRIVRFADTHDLPPIGLLAIGLQESGLNVWEHTGDRGQSEGCFQIRMWDDEGTPVHGGPPGRWQGYDGLDASMAEMGAQWHQTFVDRGGWIAWVQNV